MSDESERKTRRKRIDPKLDAAGWRLRGKDARRTEEEETSNGPADYALWLGAAPISGQFDYAALYS